MLQYAAVASGETGLRKLPRSSIESRTLAERYSSKLMRARLEVKASGLSRGRQCLPFKACGAGYSKYANNLCECPNSARFTRSRVFRRRSSPPTHRGRSISAAGNGRHAPKPTSPFKLPTGCSRTAASAVSDCPDDLQERKAGRRRPRPPVGRPGSCRAANRPISCRKKSPEGPKRRSAQ